MRMNWLFLAKFLRLCTKHIFESILNFIICLSRNPYLSRTHDIEASFTPLHKSKPNLSRGLNWGFYGTPFLVHFSNDPLAEQKKGRTPFIGCHDKGVVNKALPVLKVDPSS